MFQKIFHQLRTLMRMRTMVKFSCSVSDATRVRLYCSRAGEEASLINKTVRKFEHKPERETIFSETLFSETILVDFIWSDYLSMHIFWESLDFKFRKFQNCCKITEKKFN